MQGLDLIEIPPERGDRLRIVEQRLRQDVALALIGLERVFHPGSRGPSNSASLSASVIP